MKILNPTQERGHVGLGRNDIMRVIYTILASVLYAAGVRGQSTLPPLPPGYVYTLAYPPPTPPTPPLAPPPPPFRSLPCVLLGFGCPLPPSPADSPVSNPSPPPSPPSRPPPESPPGPTILQSPSQTTVAVRGSALVPEAPPAVTVASPCQFLGSQQTCACSAGVNGIQICLVSGLYGPCSCAGAFPANVPPVGAASIPPFPPGTILPPPPPQVFVLPSVSPSNSTSVSNNNGAQNSPLPPPCPSPGTTQLCECLRQDGSRDSRGQQQCEQGGAWSNCICLNYTPVSKASRQDVVTALAAVGGAMFLGLVLTALGLLMACSIASRRRRNKANKESNVQSSRWKAIGGGAPVIFSPPRKVQRPNFPSLATSTTSTTPFGYLSRMNRAFSGDGRPDVEGATLPQIGVGAQVEATKEGVVGTQLWERLGSHNGPVSSDGVVAMGVGRLPSGQLATIEKVPMQLSMSEEGFEQKMECIGSIRHPHVTELLGYCYGSATASLASLYMPGGSLDLHLRAATKDGGSPLSDWNRRVKVAIGAARGLAHLHNLDPPLIHGRLRSRSIQLDDECNAKIGGLASAHVLGPMTIHMRGHKSRISGLGYLAPEHHDGRHPTISTATDVFCFGVILLELITGQKSLDPKKPPALRSLVKWTRPYLDDPARVSAILDPSLGHTCPKNTLIVWASLASKCLQEDPSKRCRMADVVHALGPLHFHSQPRQPHPCTLPPSTYPTSPESSPTQRSTKLIVKSTNSEAAHGPRPSPLLPPQKRAHVSNDHVPNLREQKRVNSNTNIVHSSSSGEPPSQQPETNRNRGGLLSWGFGQRKANDIKVKSAGAPIHPHVKELPSGGSHSVEHPSAWPKRDLELGATYSIPNVKSVGGQYQPRPHRPPAFSREQTPRLQSTNHNTGTSNGVKVSNVDQEKSSNPPSHGRQVGKQSKDNWRALAAAHGSSPEWEGPASSKLWGETRDATSQ